MSAKLLSVLVVALGCATKQSEFPMRVWTDGFRVLDVGMKQIGFRPVFDAPPDHGALAIGALQNFDRVEEFGVGGHGGMEGSEEFVTYRFTGRFQSDGDDLRHGLYEFVRASDWTAEETWDYEVAAIVDHFEQYGASESVSRLGGCLRVAYPSAAAALTRVLFDASLRNAQRHDRCVGELLLPALKQCDYIGDANSVGVLIGVEPRLTALVSRMDSNAREDALFLAISQSSEALLQAIRLGIRSASVESGLHIALESAEASDLVEWAERVPAWADKSCETVLFFRLGRARLLGSPGTTEIEAALEVLRRRRQELR